MRNQRGEGKKERDYNTEKRDRSKERGDKFYGLDTETPLGRLKIIATNTEAKEINSFNEILSFFAEKKYTSSIFFTFNLQFDIEAILKLTNDMEFLKTLYFEGAAPKGIEYNNNVRIRYIPSKFLRICFKTGKSSKCVSLFDIAQFYGGWSLEKASQKYLGEGKNTVSAERIGEEEGYYEQNKEAVKEYCIKDAGLTLKLAMLMKDTIENVAMPKGHLTFRNPISQAKVAEMYVRDNFSYPKIPEKLEFYHWLAGQSYHGGIFSTLKRGFFNRPLYSYDINSAYPYEMDKLVHWANGRFLEVKSPDEIDTRYGWFLCEFDCEHIPYPDYSTPYIVPDTLFDGKKGEEIIVNPKRIVYPSGFRTQWVTKIEYDWMVNNNFEPKFKNGFVWEQTKDEYVSPFSWVKDVYYARQQIKKEDKEDIRQWALKIAMNGFYGKTVQKRKGIGALTNFFYGSYITAGTRLQIMDVGLQKPEHVIEYATDSILTDSPLDLPISNKLGEWSEAKYEKGLLIGSGIRQQWNKDGSFITHARGLTYRNDYDMLSEMEKEENIYSDYLYFEKKRPLHLGEVIFHHKILSLEDLGVFTTVSKRLSVNTDKKRNWDRDYTDFSDLLDNEPMNSIALNLDEEFYKKMNSDKANDYMRRMDLKRAKKMRYSDIATDIDPVITTRHGKDLEIMNEMKRYMKEERFMMDGR